MKIYIDFGYANVGDRQLHEFLQLPEKHMEIEASTTREVFERLRTQSPVAQEIFKMQFHPNGVLDGGWMIVLNRGSTKAKGIKSDADLDIPLNEGDRIYISSIVCGG